MTEQKITQDAQTILDEIKSLRLVVEDLAVQVKTHLKKTSSTTSSDELNAFDNHMRKHGMDLLYLRCKNRGTIEDEKDLACWNLTESFVQVLMKHEIKTVMVESEVGFSLTPNSLIICDIETTHDDHCFVLIVDKNSNVHLHNIYGGNETYFVMLFSAEEFMQLITEFMVTKTVTAKDFKKLFGMSPVGADKNRSYHFTSFSGQRYDLEKALPVLREQLKIA